MSILTTPLPGSRKVYVEGSRADLRVPMREIELLPTTSRNGEEQENAPIRVYDASGPYTDLNYKSDIRSGLPALWQAWIEERGDVEAYEGRVIKPLDNGFHSEDTAVKRGAGCSRLWHASLFGQRKVRM